MKDTKEAYELTDDELAMVIGGLTQKDYEQDLKKTHEIELGDFIPDAYNHNSKDSN